MADYLARLLEHIGADKDTPVLAHGLSADGSEYVAVLDRGIKGAPKYRVALNALAEPAVIEPEPEPEPEPAGEGGAPTGEEPANAPDTGLSELSYRELQELAKETGIPANQSAEELRAALESADAW